jgi:hypothetical protein
MNTQGTATSNHAIERTGHRSARRPALKKETVLPRLHLIVEANTIPELENSQRGIRIMTKKVGIHIVKLSLVLPVLKTVDRSRFISLRGRKNPRETHHRKLLKYHLHPLRKETRTSKINIRGPVILKLSNPARDTAVSVRKTLSKRPRRVPNVRQTTSITGMQEPGGRAKRRGRTRKRLVWPLV